MPATWLCSAQTTRFPNGKPYDRQKQTFGYANHARLPAQQQTPLAVRSNQGGRQAPILVACEPLDTIYVALPRCCSSAI